MTCYRHAFLLPALTCIALFTASGALASPELARSWSAQAETLGTELKTSPPVLPDRLISDLKRFGRISTRLSKSGTEEIPIPKDLGCIFRGMAEETKNQLAALETATSDDERLAAEERLEDMLDDAVSVGLAAALVLEGKTPELGETNTKTVSGTCPATKASHDQYLTEHP